MSVKAILAHYSPEDILVQIGFRDGNTHQISGTMDGQFLSAVRVIDHATPFVGSDGSNARVIRDVRNYNFTLSLMQTSESNDVLQTLLDLDAATRDGSQIFSFMVKDLIGRTLISTNTAYIGTPPEVNFSTEVEGRDWVISGIDVRGKLGGNALMTNPTFGLLTGLGQDIDPRWSSNNLG